VSKPGEDPTTPITRRYFDHFDPDLYDPAVWAREARAPGMKYFVGDHQTPRRLLLWDSDLTITKRPHPGTGAILSTRWWNAFRAEGLKSASTTPAGWHHPDFRWTGCPHARTTMGFRAARKGASSPYR
jgi:alpha-L-fucosidase